jgi:hypothetical protein
MIDALKRHMARYTHRVAISNSRFVALNKHSVAFKWKDYRVTDPHKTKVMTLAITEFIRRTNRRRYPILATAPRRGPRHGSGYSSRLEQSRSFTRF